MNTGSAAIFANQEDEILTHAYLTCTGIGDIKKDGTVGRTVNISKQYIPGFRSTELINCALIS